LGATTPGLIGRFALDVLSDVLRTVE